MNLKSSGRDEFGCKLQPTANSKKPITISNALWVKRTFRLLSLKLINYDIRHMSALLLTLAPKRLTPVIALFAANPLKHPTRIHLFEFCLG
jgi:hypothetical protein